MSLHCNLTIIYQLFMYYSWSIISFYFLLNIFYYGLIYCGQEICHGEIREWLKYRHRPMHVTDYYRDVTEPEPPVEFTNLPI